MEYMKDPFQILGISRNASKDEIYKQYKKLSLETHPDRPGGNHDKFTEIKNAYDSICSEKEHDLFNHSKPFFGGIPQHTVFMETDLNGDLLAAMLGGLGGIGGLGGLGHSQFYKPASGKNSPFMEQVKTEFEEDSVEDIETTLNITFEDSFTGASLPLIIERKDYRNRNVKFSKETLYIDVPEGVDHGEILLIKKKGNISKQGNMSDLKLTVNVNDTEHINFKRKGLDLEYRINLTLKEALGGFSKQIVHLNNTIIKINSPKGTIIQNLSKRKVQGLGFKRKERTGNLYVIFNINIPKELSLEKIDQIMAILPED
jgi:DnaJ-class molecular chaperone